MGSPSTSIPTSKAATMSQAAYDAAYLASLPPAILALMSLPVDYYTGQPSGGRTAGLIALVAKGYIIDPAIMVLGEDPFETMQARASYGYTGVLAFLQSAPMPDILPGVTYNGVTGPASQGPVQVYWPNPPAPLAPSAAAPVAYTIIEAIVGYPGFYEISPDGPNLAVGQVVNVTASNVSGVPLGNYIKTVIGNSPFAPNGQVTAWKLQGAS